MNPEGTEQALLIALLDGTLPQDEAAALHARIASDPALQQDYAALAAFHAGLETLGGALAVDAPDIDITERVMQSAREIAAGVRPAREDGLPEDLDLIACLEGAAPEGFEQRLVTDTDLQREYQALQGLWKDLEVLA